MDIGTKLVHMHYPEISIEIVDFTNKGFKVLETEKKGRKKVKPKTKFYERLYIVGERAQFKLINS